MNEQKISLNGLEINYVEGEVNGRPLLLIHGGSARWQAFANIIPELSANHHLFAPDLRGHGKSGRAAGQYAVADYAQDIIAFIHACVDEPPILLGHSLGGIVALMVAAQMAAQTPESLTAVLVGDSPLTASTWRTVLANGRDGLIAWRDLSAQAYTNEQLVEAAKNSPMMHPQDGRRVPMRQVFGEENGVYDWIAGNLYYQDPDVLTILIEAYDRAAAGYEMEQLMPAIDCPVLLLQADPDAGGLMTDAEVGAAMKLLRQPSHIKLSGLSHVLHNEDKMGVLTAVFDYLSTL
jgi:pimeloyl-ACP methyl ester carboxylesterase